MPNIATAWTPGETARRPPSSLRTLLDFVLVSSRRRRLRPEALDHLQGPRRARPQTWVSSSKRTLLHALSYEDDAGSVPSAFVGAGDTAALMVGFAFRDRAILPNADDVFSGSIELPSGVFTAIQVSRDTASVRVGMLGSMPLFTFSGEHHLILSNNPRLARQAAEALGNRVAVDLSQLVWLPTLTNMGTEKGLVQSLRLLPMGVRSFVLTRGILEVERSDSPLDAYTESVDPYDLVQSTASELTTAVYGFVAPSHWSLSADLTGGLDSRVVLSSITATASLSDFRIVTYGRDGNRADAQVAGMIANQLGFDLHEKEAERKQTFVDPTASDRAKWFSNGIESNIQINDGHVQAFTALSLRPATPGRLALWGLFGENMRSFYGKKVDKLPGSCRDSHSIARSTLVNLELLRSSYLDYAIETLADFLRARFDAGLTPVAAADTLFVERRSRWFHGLSLTGQWYTHASYSPLLSINAIRLAHMLGDRARIRNAAPYRIIERLNPRLLDIPFANFEWTGDLHPTAPNPIRDTDRPLQYQYRWFDAFVPEIERALAEASQTCIWEVFDQRVARDWLIDSDRTHHQMMGLINLYGLVRAVESW